MDSLARRLGRIGAWLLLALSFCACAAEEEPQKIRDLEFTVTAPEHVPEELQERISGQKEEKFCMTYVDGGWLYVAAGYGAQEGGGFCVQVRKFYEAANAVYFDTNLLGPEQEDVKGGTSYPYIVVKTEDPGKPVVFQ